MRVWSFGKDKEADSAIFREHGVSEETRQKRNNKNGKTKKKEK